MALAPTGLATGAAALTARAALAVLGRARVPGASPPPPESHPPASNAAAVAAVATSRHFYRPGRR